MRIIYLGPLQGAPADSAVGMDGLLAPVDQDVLGELLWQGNGREQAVAMVRNAKAMSKVSTEEFEPLFRRALEFRPQLPPRSSRR